MHFARLESHVYFSEPKAWWLIRKMVKIFVSYISKAQQIYSKRHVAKIYVPVSCCIVFHLVWQKLHNISGNVQLFCKRCEIFYILNVCTLFFCYFWEKSQKRFDSYGSLATFAAPVRTVSWKSSRAPGKRSTSLGLLWYPELMIFNKESWKIKN